MIEVKQQKITINGEDTLLFGAELHYFRVPKQQWRSRVRQVKEAGINMISTYVPWMFHEYEEGSIDLEGETRGERDLVSFLQMISEEGMYCLVRPGPYVMAEIVDHGIPPWLLDSYPEAVAKTENGSNHPTRMVSYMHPVFLEKAANWYDHVCQVIERFQIQKGGPVIFFQLDNEVGMFHWVTNQGDYNQETVTQFAKYLENKYTLDSFNQTFHVEVNSIKEFISEKLTSPEKRYGVVLNNEYSHFMRKHYRDYIEHLKQLAEKGGIEVPFVVNIHGFDTVDILKRGTMYPIGLSQLHEAAKIENVLLAGDYYIGNIEHDSFIDIVVANAFTNAVQWKEQPLFSAEFQGGTIPDKPRLQPSTYDLTTRLCVSGGMDAMNYYMFVGGENYEGMGILGKRHDWQAPLSLEGKKRQHFPVIGHLGNMFHVFQKPLVNTSPEIDTYFGFNPDYYQTEFSNAFNDDMKEQIHMERDINISNGVARGLRMNNVTFDGVNLVDEEKIDPASVPSLWMFTTTWMNEAVQQKLVSYLQEGGRLVMFPVLPTKNMNDEPCTILKDFIGVEVTGSESNGFADIGEVDNVKADGMETYQVSEGAFGTVEGEPDKVVAFEKRLGNGKLVMFGVSMESDYEYKYPIYRDLAAKVSVSSKFTLEDEVDISTRSLDSGGRFIFLHNFDEYEKVTPITYKRKSLFEGKEITVPGRSGLMLPVDIPVREDLTMVYGTGEVFKIEENKQELALTARIRQEEEEFLFRSDHWVPVEDSGINIEKSPSSGIYRVKINSRKETETIRFIS